MSMRTKTRYERAWWKYVTGLPTHRKDWKTLRAMGDAERGYPVPVSFMHALARRLEAK